MEFNGRSLMCRGKFVVVFLFLLRRLTQIAIKVVKTITKLKDAGNKRQSSYIYLYIYILYNFKFVVNLYMHEIFVAEKVTLHDIYAWKLLTHLQYIMKSQLRCIANK